MNNKITFEIVWWVITLLVALLVILPIYTSIGGDFLFYIENIVAIVVFITLTRWMFLLRHTFFGRNIKFKVVLLFLMIPLFFICYDNLIDFQSYLDEEDPHQMVLSLPFAERPQMAKYMKYEYMLFGTASIISIIAFPFRMVLSVWRQVNKGTV